MKSFTGSADLTEIGANAFQDCSSLTDIDLNDGLKTIGSYAFQNCEALEKIVLPDSVTSIGSYVFQKDGALKDVTLSKGLTTIPSYAFANCLALEIVDVPKGVTAIKDHAFYQDTKLKTFTLPVTVSSIESNAISYVTTSTLNTVAGSYAEGFAKWQAVNDITKAATGLKLANGSNEMTMGRSLTVMPRFAFAPIDSTDAVQSLTSDNTNVVSVRDNVKLYGNRAGTANITATTYGGLTYSFAVTVDTVTGLEIGQQPSNTDYNLKDRKDISGLVVNAVFSNGDKEAIDDYTLSGFTTDVKGTHDVTATYNKQSATFPIYVGVKQSGNLGEHQELKWEYDSRQEEITVTGEELTPETPVLAATYTEDGKMQSFRIILISGEKIKIGSDFSSAKLIWIDENQTPRCADVEIAG